MQNLMPPINTPDKLFHDGDPTNGIDGTIVPSEWLNNDQSATRDLQQEVISVLSAAGIVPDESKQDQLVNAIMSLVENSSQPLDDTLTALASLVGAANKLAYFTGAETAALTNFTDVGRNIVGKNTVADVLLYMGLVNANGYSGRLSGIPKLITTSGTYTTPPGVKALIVEVIGAGAGGGGTLSAAAGAHSVTGGGGSGGIAESFIANPAATYNVTIGAGGKGGTTAGTSGADGGTTSFGAAAIATGGTGGTGSTTIAISQTNAIVAAGGYAGKGTVGNIRCGSNESAGVSVGTNYGNISSGGGSTPYGTGGIRVGLSMKGNQPGFSATGYGAGGSGAISIDAGGAAAGGDGSDGCVLVWELY